MPARDAGATLARAMRSVRASRDVALELVVVDHASTDETRVLAEDAARHDPRVRVIAAPRALGLGGALTLGLADCRAPLVARMDADDVMHPARLAEDVAYLAANPHVDVVACRARLFPARAVGQGMRAYVAWQNAVLTADDHAREVWIEQPVCHPACTFRKRVLEDVGAWRDGPFPEDYDLFLRLARARAVVEKRPAFHHAWRVHANQATRTDPRYARDRHAELKARALRDRFALVERPVFVAGAGKEGGRIGRALIACGVAPARYFDVSPARIGRIRHGAPVDDAAELARAREESPESFVIGAVGTSGARGIVRDALMRAGYVEGASFVVVC